MKTWAIPASRANPAAESPRDPSGPAVQALAVSPSGDEVAVGLSFSSSVEVLDVAKNSWERLPLPASYDEPISLGYSRAGVLAAGYADLRTHEDTGVLIALSNGTAVRTTVAEAWSVVSYGPDQFLVGASRPSVVSPDGTVTRLNTPAVALDPFEPATSPAYLPGRRIAFTIHGGVIEFPEEAASSDAASARATAYDAPMVKCPVIQPPPVQGSSPAPTASPASAATRRCLAFIYLMTADVAGNIWIVTQGQQSSVQLLVAPATAP